MTVRLTKLCNFLQSLVYKSFHQLEDICAQFFHTYDWQVEDTKSKIILQQITFLFRCHSWEYLFTYLPSCKQKISRASFRGTRGFEPAFQSVFCRPASGQISGQKTAMDTASDTPTTAKLPTPNTIRRFSTFQRSTMGPNVVFEPG